MSSSVLSTFLVTTVLLDSLSRRNSPQGRRFFTRRARRLAAGLAAMVSVVLVLVAIGTYKSPETARTAIGAVLLHANVAQFSGDYFSAFAQRNPLEHTWSLSVEEHFYLATFLAVLVLWKVSGHNLKRTRQGLLVLSGVVAVGSVIVSRHLLHVGATPNRMYMGTDTRAVAAATGVAVAAALWGRWDLQSRYGSGCGVVARLVSLAAWALFIGIVVAALLRWYPTLEWFASGGWAVSALAGALWSSARSRDHRGKVSGNAAFQWAGRRSYGIYLGTSHYSCFPPSSAAGASPRPSWALWWQRSCRTTSWRRVPRRRPRRRCPDGPCLRTWGGRGVPGARARGLRSA
ncbi:MAG: acyltransferase [Microthrixaceae bacterium]|nr:acyltransferase [Microthrixaceae bacterium]